MGTITARKRADNAYTSFASAKYWPALDGLRALSIVLVLTAHMNDTFWNAVNGSLGVVLFFVISGFLITTLLLREEQRNGGVSLSKFYIRRAFRIIPLYAVALALFSFLILALGQGQGSSNYLERLPWLATFNGEFAGTGTFSHSWSLGIEEKFYVVWPVLAFGLVFARRLRGESLTVIVPLAAVAAFVPALGYFGIYFPILGGCALAVAAHNPRTFTYVHALARPFPAMALFALMIAMLFMETYIPFEEVSGYANTAFALTAILALPAVVLAGNWVHRFFGLPALAYYGTRAYGIYLFHPLCLEVVDRVVPPGSDSLALVLVRFLLVFVTSFVTAEFLYRIIEKPLINVGRRITTKTTAENPRTMEPSAK